MDQMSESRHDNLHTSRFINGYLFIKMMTLDFLPLKGQSSPDLIKE